MQRHDSAEAQRGLVYELHLLAYYALDNTYVTAALTLYELPQEFFGWKTSKP